MHRTSTATGAPRSTPSATSRAPRRDQVAQGHAGGPAQLQRLQARVGRRRPRRRASSPAPAARARSARNAWSTCDRPECRSRCPAASLDSLAKPPADRQARHRVTPQVLQHRAREVPHVQQRVLGQAVARRTRPAPRSTRCSPATWVRPAARGDVHAPADAVDPRRARVRHDDAGRAEDRQAAEDAEPRVPGVPGDLLAVVHRDLTSTSPAPPCPARRPRATCSRIICARHRVDRRLADLQRQPGQGDRADAGPGTEDHPGARGRRAAPSTGPARRG